MELRIYSPSGKKFYPWSLNPENSEDKAIRTTADYHNVVEQIYINESEIQEEGAGEWLVVVSVADSGVITLPQKYSLVSKQEIS